MIVEIKMPSLGMTMDEGRIVAWHAKEGELVAKGQLLLEIEGEKTIYEIEAPSSGVLSRVLRSVDAVAPVGAVLGEIASGD